MVSLLSWVRVEFIVDITESRGVIVFSYTRVEIHFAASKIGNDTLCCTKRKLIFNVLCVLSLFFVRGQFLSLVLSV